MGLMLPGWLRTALEYVGYDWPSTDESVLNQWGGQWDQLSQKASTSAESVNGIANEVLGKNSGASVEAFKTWHSDAEAPMKSAHDLSLAATGVGIGLRIIAGIVLAMKVAVIAQLAILAASIASAVATAGLASGAVLAARQAAKWAIEAAINYAVEMIMNGMLG